ncbi:transcriptional regulator [Paenibacillus helianthi]|uniref:Transcriptional regulator n=1 Tax=Paenibacillus helianthi TaxID=1349432 RepID=A0ABX3EJA3_9BACL|nr:MULTISPECIES: MerR family transcriptional regulator [Paenibacillus]OKP81509.1 transcriptional regulator [Paenibacillus helianthi]OKP83005.1 transcriptional regulator [Paenibacillus sp. P32E]OKP93180.1 transcriptional regulator [Paenibacillus sp. P3E]
MENKFSSKQVAEETGLSIHTLRYYEQIGLIDGIERDDNGYRLYSQADMVWFKALHYFRSMGMPVREIQKLMAVKKSGVSTITARREFIENYRGTVIEQRKELDLRLEKVDQKIDFFKRLESAQLELER